MLKNSHLLSWIECHRFINHRQYGKVMVTTKWKKHTGLQVFNVTAPWNRMKINDLDVELRCVNMPLSFHLHPSCEMPQNGMELFNRRSRRSFLLKIIKYLSETFYWIKYFAAIKKFVRIRFQNNFVLNSLL